MISSLRGVLGSGRRERTDQEGLERKAPMSKVWVSRAGARIGSWDSGLVWDGEKLE